MSSIIRAISQAISLVNIKITMLQTQSLGEVFDLAAKNGMLLSAGEYDDLVVTVNRKVRLIESIDSRKEFFLQLADFFEFLTKSPKLSAALEVIRADYVAQTKGLEEMREMVGREAEEAFWDIRKSILEDGLVDETELTVLEEYFENYKLYRRGEKKLTDEQVKIVTQRQNRIFAEIKDYYSWKAGATQNLAGELVESSLVGAVESIVRACKEAGHTEVVKRYLELESNQQDGKEYIISYKVSPTIGEYREEKKLLDRKLEASPWRAFQKMELIPLTIYGYRDYMKKLVDDHNTAEMMGLGGYVGEMNKIMEGKENDRWFSIVEHKLYLRRVVDSVLDVLKLVRDYTREAGPDFKEGENVIFENDVIHFKMGDGTRDSIDLSTAQVLVKIFKTFWELRKRNPGETLFLPATVIETYQEVNKEEITRRLFSSRVSNLRQTKIYPKTNLKGRLSVGFDRKSKSWYFNIS